MMARMATRAADATHLVQDLLELLRARSRYGLVMLTRVVGDDWQVVAATENPYGVAAGDVFRWSDSICSRMITAAAPAQVIDDVAAHDVASSAPVTSRLEIASYAGAPVVGDDGSLVGTVCAIDPAAVDGGVDADLFAFAGRLGAHALALAASTEDAGRRAERALFPREGDGAVVAPGGAWPGLLVAEAARVRWTNEPLAIALVRTAGDEVARRPAVDRVVRRLAAGLGRDDVVSVLGSNRIGVLAVGRTAVALQAALDELAAAEPLDTITSDVAGPDPAGVVEQLEAELVGAPAAAARQSSRLLRYSFCDSCGRKGRYRSPAVGVTRCKYCGVVEA